MIPLYETDGRSTCPMGMPMCQNRLAVPFWSYAMELHPPARVIEIGSFNGAFAVALGLHARAIGARMITYDITPCGESIVPIGRAIGVEFRTASCWDVQAEIAELIRSPGLSMVLCDGGDKPRELEVFGAYLKPGDVLASHDYNATADDPERCPAPPEGPYWPWCEMRKFIGDPIAAKYGLEPFMQEHMNLAGWLAYRKP